MTEPVGRVGIDVGGTFTDGVMLGGGGAYVRRAKAPTTPGRLVEGFINVLQKLGVDVHGEEVELLVHGTTVVTNLLLERRGCRVGLMTTAGFRDVLEIGRGTRPESHDLRWVKPEPLVPRELRLEVDERTLSDGRIVLAPRREQVSAKVDALLAGEVDVVAVAFINSFANPTNEVQVGEWIRDLAQIPVTLSCMIDPQVREFERCSTTAVNAYAIPATRSYIRDLTQEVRRDVLFMHSGGGVLPAAVVEDAPVKLVMSGPAAGVVAAQDLGGALQEPNLITFDMGGTSTDVAVIMDGHAERADETEIAWGVPVRAESLAIRSIGAGGGSIAWRDPGGGLQVGPLSAGAEPGPACYRRGGTKPTVTDANVLLGLVHPDRFLGGEMRLDVRSAQTAVAALAREFSSSVEDCSLGIHRVVNANMAGLIREMTVNKGRDPRDFALVAAGGAGGQHAAGVAALVGCHRVVFPRESSTFSALGLTVSELRTTEAQSLLRPLDALASDKLNEAFAALERRVVGRFERNGLSAGAGYRLAREISIRYVGQTHAVRIGISSRDDIASIYDRFEATHRDLYGTRLGDPAEVVTAHLTVARARDSQGDIWLSPADPDETSRALDGAQTIPVEFFGGEVPIFDATQLVSKAHVLGPALVVDVDTTIVIPERGTLRAVSGRVFVLDLATEEPRIEADGDSASVNRGQTDL